jgi:hypothetical protein
MALTVAAALGLLLLRHLIDDPAMWRNSRWLAIATGARLIALPLTLCLTALVLGERQSRKRHVGSVGGLTCLAASLTTVLAQVCMAHAYAAAWGMPRNLWRAAIAHLANPMPIASSVASVWLVLWLTRRWRRGRGWLDYAGRIIGVFWILSAVAFPILSLVL